MFPFKGARPELRGYLDTLDGDRVAGWASDRVRPRKRLTVEVYAGGTLVGTAKADLFRQDLADAGIGDGRYGFTFTAEGLGCLPETVAVKVQGSGVWLVNTAPAARLAPPDALVNAPARGLPALRPGLSSKAVDEADVAVARELQQAFVAHPSRAGAGRFAIRDSMWGGIVARRHKPLLTLIAGDDPRLLAAFLVDIQKNLAAEGIMQGEASYRDFLEASPEGRRVAVMPFHDMLASLAQYMALMRADCAEQEFEGEAVSLPSDALVARIEAALGHALAPPTIFDGLFGLQAGERVLHGRDIQALYAALRVVEASGLAQPRVCEIGGGFGKVAYYAWLNGVRRYAIVDLPSVAAMQYFTLRRSLPDVPVRILPPGAPANAADGIDLVLAPDLEPATIVAADIVLNCDSFPEMGEATCRRYLDAVPSWAPWLLSINQEANREGRHEGDRQIVVAHLVRDLAFTRSYRFRSWVRRGFVEELWRTRAPA